MGVVYAARHVELDQRVALKVIRSELAGNTDVVTRFMREARASVRIDSEHVVRVSDVGQVDDGPPFMAMELLEGVDLAEFLAVGGPLPVEDAVDYVLQASDAIVRAHSIGIIHRDLKPANLFLTKSRDGHPSVKVLDFGISKSLDSDPSELSMTASAAVLGSPHYMSPEQMSSSRDVDVRTDIWSLGVILFKLLSGEVPFNAETLVELYALISATRAKSVRTLRPEVPKGLAAVIQACLERNIDERTPSVSALAAALAPYAPPRSRPILDRISSFAQPGMTMMMTRSQTVAPFTANTPLPSLPRSKGTSRLRWILSCLGLLATLVVTLSALRVRRPSRLEVAVAPGSAPVVAAVTSADAAAASAVPAFSEKEAQVAPSTEAPVKAPSTSGGPVKTTKPRVSDKPRAIASSPSGAPRPTPVPDDRE